MIRSTTLRLAALLACLSLPAVGSAQGFDAQAFHPTPSQDTGFGSVGAARTPAHLQWSAGLTLNYARNVLVQRDAEGNEVHAPIASLLTTHLTGSVGLLGDLDVGLDIPIHLASGGDDAPPATAFLETRGGGGFGDIRIVPRYRFFSTAEGNGRGLHLAGMLNLVLPTGDRDRYLGGGFQIEPRVVAEWAGHRSAVALNVGYLSRDQAYIGEAGLEVDDAITWGVGFRAFVTDTFAFVGDFHGEIGYASVTPGTEPHPIEGILGGELAVSDFKVRLGFGRGLSHGFGVPDFRLLAGVTYGGAVDLDRDDDEIPNRLDACPDQAEDFDRFEDEDGCPELDNDQDGVDDRADRCDDEVEDMDGFEDDDGCPDPDNDGDSILDADDMCPDEAEDIDLFEDEDGCPELDNDQDGVLDADDSCVSEPEDMDGFEDDDGCPELDNDQDGVLDADDACPDEPEVTNGVDDEDGCPDESAILIDFDASVIQPVGDLTWFIDISSNLTPEALTALAATAQALEAYPELTLRVVVRSADRAMLTAREAISLRRGNTVKAALTTAGIAAERVEVSPYAQPIESGATGYEVELRLTR